LNRKRGQSTGFFIEERAAYKKAIEQEILVRAKEKKEPIIASNVINKTSPILETVPWYCVSCQHEYQGYSLGLNPCPKCDSHFYRKML
jgi:Zn finger protein HypA/HybF involved in hydrogenase expression